MRPDEDGIIKHKCYMKKLEKKKERNIKSLNLVEHANWLNMEKKGRKRRRPEHGSNCRETLRTIYVRQAVMGKGRTYPQS